MSWLGFQILQETLYNAKQKILVADFEIDLAVKEMVAKLEYLKDTKINNKI